MSKAKRSAKIRDYKILEAYVQCDFLDGYTYIDKAGEIINSFVRENKEIPKFNMGLDGLVIEDISETVKEFRISSNRIWIHYVEPKNLGDISDTSSDLIQRALDTLKPTMFRRIGWRSYFVREDVGSGGKNPVNSLRLSANLNGFNLHNVVLAKKVNNYDVRADIRPVVNAIDPRKQALMFDIDVSKDIKEFDKKNTVVDIHEVIKSDALLDKLGGLIK